MKKQMSPGTMAFYAGLLLTFFGSLVTAVAGATWFVWVALFLGIVVGLLNVAVKETKMFLISAIAFMLVLGTLVTIFNSIPGLGEVLASFLSNFATFVGAAVAPVALMKLFKILEK